MERLPVLHQANELSRRTDELPSIVQNAGPAAERAWDDFFKGVIANDLTRLAYTRAVRRFLEWPRVSDKKLHEITAADVG